MKKYIKPEVEVYTARIQSLLSGSGEHGQITEGDAKRHNNSLFDEEDDDSQAYNGSLWDDDWSDMK